jgi:hypothetical protein
MLRDESFLLDMLMSATEVRDLGAAISWDEFRKSRLH